MENEVMENEEVMEPEVDITEEESGNSAIGFGLAVAIGAGLTLAATAAVKFGKKAYAKIKAKKEAPDDADERDFVIPTDEEIDNVTK